MLKNVRNRTNYDLFTLWCERCSVDMADVKSYTLRFKSHVLKKLEENNGNILKTSQEVGVDRKNIQRWLSQKI